MPDLDEDGDRVYTVDAVHGVLVMAPEDCYYFGTGDVGVRAVGGGWAEEEEIQKLKARLQALEADRESMRHAIMSMGDEKAQVVLLREIAQQLCKVAAPFPAIPGAAKAATSCHCTEEGGKEGDFLCQDLHCDSDQGKYMWRCVYVCALFVYCLINST